MTRLKQWANVTVTVLSIASGISGAVACVIPAHLILIPLSVFAACCLAMVIVAVVGRV